MKIAMLGHKRMPSREGGVEVVVEELATRMAALGHEVIVYSRKGRSAAGKNHEGPVVSEYKGVIVKEVPTLDVRGLAAFTSSYFATKAALADKPDVIHFHAEGPSAMISMAKRAGVRSVATIHGLDWQRAKWGKIASSYIRYGESVAARDADEVIVLSEGARDYFRHAYGRETRLIPNGIASSTPVGRTEAISGIVTGDTPYALYLGRIVPEKGVHYLVDAYSRIDSDRLLIIAGGPSDSVGYYNRVKEMALGDGRVVFPGFVQGRVLEELYSNADVFVLPSDLEGMPMGLLEAMSYGCCCLTSNIPECADVLGGCGETFEAGSVSRLTEKLNALLSDEHKRRLLGDAARKRVASLYDWDAVVERTLELYMGGNA